MKKNMLITLAMALGFSATCAVGLGIYGSVEELPTNVEAVNESEASWGPRWQIGDTWLVETKTKQNQQSVPTTTGPATVRWRFTVECVEQVGGSKCYKTSIVCCDGKDDQQRILIWVDVNSGMLRRLRAVLYYAGVERHLEESYYNLDGRVVPVMGTIPALPIDMPIFSQSKSSNSEKFTYRYHQGPVTKASESFPITCKVEQVEKVGATNERVFELTDGNQTTIQRWNLGKPWPTFSDNGVTEAKLLEDGE